EAGVGLPLQARQVEEQGRGLGRGPGFLGDGAGPALARRDDLLGPGAIPEALGPRLRVVSLAEVAVEPATGVGPGGHAELCMDLIVGTRDEALDLLLALDHDRQRRRLDAPDGGQVEAAVARIER